MGSAESQQTDNVKDDQGQVSAQAEPKGKNAIDEIVEILRGWRPSFQQILLEELRRKEEKSEEETGYLIAKQIVEEQEKSQTPTIDKQTQQRIRDYYTKLPAKMKLTIVTLSELMVLDGINFKSKVFNEIYNELETTCFKKYNPDTEAKSVVVEDFWLAGVWQSCRMIVQNC